MPSISEIVGTAFTAVSGAIPDAIHAATLSYDMRGPYNTATGAYAVVTITVTGGRALLDMSKPISDNFPDYIAGPTDKTIMLDGFTVVPQENWTLEFNSTTYMIKKVLDIMDAHTTFFVVAA